MAEFDAEYTEFVASFFAELNAMPMEVDDSESTESTRAPSDTSTDVETDSEWMPLDKVLPQAMERELEAIFARREAEATTDFEKAFTAWGRAIFEKLKQGQ